MNTLFSLNINNSLSGWRIVFVGQVQGVGFRPFIFNVIKSSGLRGQIYNSGADAVLELLASKKVINDLILNIKNKLPQLARIDDITQSPLTVADIETLLKNTQNERFSIADSFDEVNPSLNVAPDTAPCSDCLNELFDKHNRRFLYPFINCTQCGPRFTIINKLPYDRPNTSMHEFEQCSMCLHEYNDPSSRRFHAQPNACEQCGPQLWNVIKNTDFNFIEEPEKNAIEIAVEAIKQGAIIAMRSVGGFHLVCDAKNTEVVKKLRARKRRPTKPLAVMVANSVSANEWVKFTRSSDELLNSPQAPIVVADVVADTVTDVVTGEKSDKSEWLQELSPGLSRLGVMLPQSPLHWLLFYYYQNSPELSYWMREHCSLVLVMTSANRSGEPLITDNDEALKNLSDIADVFLLHNRDIVTRCDDSVFSAWTDREIPIRLGRGYSPYKFSLMNQGDGLSTDNLFFNNKPILALGSYLKNTVAVNRGNNICVSQHVGDLDHPENCNQLDSTVKHLLDLMKVKPGAVACDLHPEGYGRQLAERLSREYEIPLIEVPHHVAHIYSGVAENNLTTDYFGVALDGFGLGWDKKPRGGELLLIQNNKEHNDLFLPVGQVSPIAMLGGDKSSKEPWRLALSLVHRLVQNNIDLKADIYSQFPHLLTLQSENPVLIEMLNKNINCPQTTSLGRWFDAIAGLLGICDFQTYEGEAAMRLEALASQYLTREFDDFSFEHAIKVKLDYKIDIERFLCKKDSIIELNLYEVIAELMSEYKKTQSIEQFALGFHIYAAKLIAGWIEFVGKQYANVIDVILSGGCIQNRLLTEALMMELKQKNYNPILPKKIPVNDGGIAVGQILYGMKHLASECLNTKN